MLYHFHCKIISRSHGRSACAAAAYRNGVTITNPYDGVTHDYTNKQVVCHNTLLPSHAPSKFCDPVILWSDIEMSEKSSQAQLARELELALPNEFTHNQAIALVEDFLNKHFVAEGMICNYAIHNPCLRDDLGRPINKEGLPTSNPAEYIYQNLHAHVLLPLRPLTEDGKWQPKTEVVYICIKDGVEKEFTATEFQYAKLEGWEKQYQFLDGKNKKIYLTASDGTEQGFERIKRAPKTKPYGKPNPIVERWNAQDTLKQWRKDWEDAINSKCTEYGYDLTVNCRSYKDQGIKDALPLVTLSHAEIQMERKAARLLAEGVPQDQIQHSNGGEINQLIKQHNEQARSIKAFWQDLKKQSSDVLSTIFLSAQHLYRSLLLKQYDYQILDDKYKKMETDILPTYNKVEKIRATLIAQETADEKAKENIEDLTLRLSQTKPLDYKKRKYLQSQIEQENLGILHRQRHIQQLLQNCGYDSMTDYQNQLMDLYAKQNQLDQLSTILNKIEKEQSVLYNQTSDDLSKIPPPKQSAFYQHFNHTKGKVEKDVLQTLSKEQDHFNPSLFRMGLQRVNDKLNHIFSRSFPALLAPPGRDGEKMDRWTDGERG